VRVRLALLVALTALLVAPPLVAAVPPGTFQVYLDYYIQPDGTGSLIANPNSGQGSVAWQACPPGGSCSPLPANPKTDRFVSAKNTAPGTVFIATATAGSSTASASSSPYLGPVQSSAPPSVTGHIRVGGLVTPVPGSWTGGWGSEVSFMQLQVCKTSTGSGCLVISDSYYWNKCPGVGAAIAPAYEGRYLRVVDQRISTDTAFASFAVSGPESLKPIQTGPNAVAVVAGRIAGGHGLESDCDNSQPDRIDLAARPAASHGRLALGSVTCRQPCRVRVTIRQHHRHALLERDLSALVKPQRLWLPAKLARLFKPGHATVSLSSGSQTLARRGVTLP
jgi:hypothetical protein